ncbi:MAG: SdrD B-like domain-containing protein [Anaerolineales bacterium]
MPRIMISMSLLVLFLGMWTVAWAQEANGSICVLAYEDTNANGQRDTGEGPLPGIPVYITMGDGINIRSHITTTQDAPHCFVGLPAGSYGIRFADSPNHQPTTEQSANIELTGQRVSAQFGALSAEVWPEDDATTAAVDATSEEQLSTVNRLLLAGLGTIVIVLLLLGIGAVILSILM